MESLNLLHLFPFIRHSVELFEDQNRFLKKIILTGKISALDKAANLFSFTEKTIETFTELKEDLIPLLIRENQKKFTEELHSKAQISIDILIRNLFERTADVGFLATDNTIIEFIKGKVALEDMRYHLNEYMLKYSVYNEIIITDVFGKVRVNSNESNRLTISLDPIIAHVLKSDSYIERYSYTDLFSQQHKTLLFAQKIVDKNENIGVLILCFRFDDEMYRIFSSLLNPGEEIVFTDGNEIIATSNSSTRLRKGLPKIDPACEYTYHKTTLYVSAKTKGYEGYFGAPWRSVAFMNVKKTTQNAPSKDPVSAKCSLDENIKAIIGKADNVIEDLSDVIINGELIASKERAYVLTPVLDNLRNVSTAILSTIQDAVNNLENTIMEGLIYDVKTSAKLAIEIMDRNLYERANDCRWWAMTTIFQEELATSTPNTKKVGDILNHINTLYTVYTNIFIYDHNGVIVAASNDLSIIGTRNSSNYVSKTLSNHNTQYYFVSNFEVTPFYGNKATYIYSASICNQQKVLGGIGIVFDSYPQFQAILEDSFPSSKKGFSCFIDRKGVVVSSTNPEINPTDTIDLTDEILHFNSTEATHKFITYQGKKHLVGIAKSQGYREYKCQDNYKNDLLSLTFIEY